MKAARCSIAESRYNAELFQRCSQLVRRVHILSDALLLFNSEVERFTIREINRPDDTYLVHGGIDKVMLLSEARDFARARVLPIAVVTDVGQFFTANS